MKMARVSGGRKADLAACLVRVARLPGIAAYLCPFCDEGMTVSPPHGWPGRNGVAIIARHIREHHKDRLKREQKRIDWLVAKIEADA